MADQTNPFTMAGMMGMMQPNKYIDPAYKDKSLPLPGFYTGQGSNVYQPPTDAQGNPIQSFTDASRAHAAWDAAHPATTPAAPAQGTTLNTSPGAGYFQQAGPSQVLGAKLAPPDSQPGIQAMYGRNFAAFAPPAGSPLSPDSIYGGGAAGAGGGAAGGGGGQAQQNPIDMRQAYLDALANPGKVTTPGANVPQAQPLGTPSVMDSFLSAHPSGGGQGAGNYNNTGFFDTLNKLRAS